MKVSVIVTAHNYGRFLCQCLDSVMRQNFDQPYEIIAVNDGSSDDTGAILEEYSANRGDVLRVIQLGGEGLSRALNVAIGRSRGEYVVRLDADDYFDENLLMLESGYLDTHPAIDMVYPDHFRVTSEGALIDYIRAPKVGDEVTLLDRNPIPSGAMYRRRCFDAIGGYNEALKHQEDFDFWIKFVERYRVHNIGLPLVSYRKHDSSMSTNREGRMEARQFVKRRFLEERGGWGDTKILALIMAMGAARLGQEKLPLINLGGKPVLAYSVEEALKIKGVDRVVVSTEDEEVAATARDLGADVPFLRPVELASTYVPKRKVVAHALQALCEREGYVPDVVAVLAAFTPFRRAKHIREAIDTMFIYQFDSVVSVVEDLAVRWKPGPEGLVALGPQKRVVRHDKEVVYRENGAVFVVKAENLRDGTLLGERVGYVEMLEHESIRLESEYDVFVAEAIANSKAWSAS